MAAIILMLSQLTAVSQHKIPENYCITPEEMQLFNQVNDLRVEYDKSLLKLSASLSYIAQTHVNDLLNNHPDTSICSLSSWSDKGNWKACCYNTYVLDEDCMWEKPKELTTYPYRGYELVMYFEDRLNVDSVIQLWSGTKKVLDMILTRESYKQKKWICMGVGLNEHYVSVWFGQRADRTALPQLCDTTVIMPVADTMASDTIKKGDFYLIFGSFDQLQDAKEALKRIDKEKFPDAGILTKDQRYRIFLGKFDNIKAATFAKQNLPYGYKEAWILKY